MSNDLIELQAQYKDIIGEDAPNNKKNDKEWLIKKIDEFVENGPEAPEVDTEPTTTDPGAVEEEDCQDTVSEAPVVTEVDPPKTAAQEKKEAKAAAKDKTPETVVTVGEDLKAKSLVGKFYTGDGEGGNWEIFIDKSGVSYKKLTK